MINRIFTYVTDHEFGEGWIPNWLPNADPVVGVIAAHDILEHLPKGDCGAEDEFMALGACYYIRGETGYFTHQSAENALAWDLPPILARVARGDQTLRDPGTTYAIQEIDECLRTIVTKGVQLTVQEDRYGDEKILKNIPRQSAAYILGWLRKGYRAARNRYKVCGQYGVSDLFRCITEDVDRLTGGQNSYGGYGERMQVLVNLRRCTVKVRIFESKEAYY